MEDRSVEAYAPFSPSEFFPKGTKKEVIQALEAARFSNRCDVRIDGR